MFFNPAQALASEPKTATVYCASCPVGKRLYCSTCCGKLHSIGTKTQHHSLEAIDPTQSCGIYFLAPLFDFLFLPTLLFITVLKVGIPSDYMSGRDICPVIHTMRRELYHFDSGMTFLLKDKLSWACNLEDGYFRLIIDTWVRGISTDSDSFLLLASAVARSLVFHAVAVRLFILPVLVLLSTIISGAFHFGVIILSHFMPVVLPSLPAQVEQGMYRVNGMLQYLIDLALNPRNLPPPTLARLRPRTDYMDFYKYWKGRQTRMFEYFYTAAQSRLQILTVAGPVLAVLIRVLCLTTSFDWYLRRLCSMPGDVAEIHREVPGDALGHAIDSVGRTLLSRLAPVMVYHVPVSFIICAGLLYCMLWYPYFRNWIDTRNWYGVQLGKAPKTDFPCTVRWFPKTFEPDQPGRT